MESAKARAKDSCCDDGGRINLIIIINESYFNKSARVKLQNH